MKTLLLLPIFLLCLPLHKASAQGCSDAGFCSIGNLGHLQGAEKAHKQSLKLTFTTGVGDENVAVFTPAVEYTHFGTRWQLQGKVTGNYASGALGTAFGAGDVFLSATYKVPSQSHWKAAFTLGTKMPLNQGNLKEGGLSLPMQYQSSLGTVDLITGVSLSSEKWKWAAGWQQPLTGINRNNFLPVYWPDGKANGFPPTNDFRRKADVLLRSSYRFWQRETVSVEAGLLGIYHLGKDTYIDANESAKPIPIAGSEGLTLNATASVDISLNKRWSLGLTGGVPLVVREVRPDGLTRRFALAPQLIYHF